MASGGGTTSSSSSGGSGMPGSRALAHGETLCMRLWEGDPGSAIDDSAVERSYQPRHESVCYVLEGECELTCEGSVLRLRAGDSFLVPRGAAHTYKILSHLKVLEALDTPEKV